MKTKHRRAAQTKRRHQADPLAMFKLFNKLQPFTQSEVVQLTPKA